MQLLRNQIMYYFQDRREERPVSYTHLDVYKRQDTFSTNKAKYDNPENKFYKTLYKYNIMPDSCLLYTSQDEQIMGILKYLTEWLVNHILYVDGQIPKG